MNYWIQNNQSSSKQSQCLILIGPPNTGKTSFALSLADRVNYYNKVWDPDKWNNYACYSVYDNIPWNQFETLNFPDKRRLFCKGGIIHVS